MTTRGMFLGHKGFWTERHKRSLYLAVFLIIVAFGVQVIAGRYSSREAVNAHFAGDIILDNIPTVNVDFFIVQGALLFWIFCVVLLATRPRYLLFGLKTIALFIIVRAFFISLTHVGVYPSEVPLNTGATGFRFYNSLTFQGNYFFSGHTGFPFLMALIFWREKRWRYFFLGATLFFATIVLLGHVHYSIDVFAAPFITYGIFGITETVFPEDRALVEAPV